MCVVAASANCDRDGVTLDYYHVLHSKQVGTFFFKFIKLRCGGSSKLLAPKKVKTCKKKKVEGKRKCWRSLRAFLDRHVSFFSKNAGIFFL
jgi:hypothetical protein